MTGERWVIFAAGAWCAPSTIKRFLSGSTKTIACDGSLTKCFTEGFEPMWVIGDMDSVTLEALAKFQEKGGEVIKRPDQDRHDLAKALATPARTAPHPVSSLVLRGAMNNTLGPTF